LALFLAPCYSKVNENIVAFGAGLEVTYSAKSNVFTIDARGSSLEDKEGLAFDVKITGPENVNVQADITDMHAGVYSVEFTPESEGHHTIQVNLNDSPIQDSPFTVHVEKHNGRC
jgi:hypothetical protein